MCFLNFLLTNLLIFLLIFCWFLNGLEPRFQMAFSLPVMWAHTLCKVAVSGVCTPYPMLTREPTQGYVISSSQVGILGSCMYPRYQLDFSRGHGAIHQIQNANLQIALRELCFLANWKLLDSTQPLQNGAYTESLRDVDKQEPTPTPMQLVHMHGGLHPVCEISYEVPRWFFLQTEIEKELLNEGGGIQPTDSWQNLAQEKIPWLRLPCCWGFLRSKRFKKYHRDFKLDDKVQGAKGSKHHRLELVKVDGLPTESHSH